MLAKFLDARSDAHLIINFTWPKYKYINPALSYCWQMGWGWGGVWAGGRGKSLHALTPFMKKDANNWPNVVVTSSWRHFRHDVTQDPRKSRKSKFCSRILRNYIYKLPNPSFFFRFWKFFQEKNIYECHLASITDKSDKRILHISDLGREMVLFCPIIDHHGVKPLKVVYN